MELLIKAIEKDDASELRFLLEIGADMNTRNEYGFLPLHRAAYHGST